MDELRAEFDRLSTSAFGPDATTDAVAPLAHGDIESCGVKGLRRNESGCSGSDNQNVMHRKSIAQSERSGCGSDVSLRPAVKLDDLVKEDAGLPPTPSSPAPRDPVPNSVGSPTLDNLSLGMLACASRLILIRNLD